MARISNYVELRKTGLVARLTSYIDLLKATPMTPGDIAHHGYEYALALLYEGSTRWTRADEDISFETHMEAREQAAKLLALAMSASDPINLVEEKVCQEEKPGYLAYLRTLSKEGLINELYNSRVAEWADFDDEDHPPDSDHHGKRIPYIGWFWRHADFANKQISIGNTGGYIGVMENNKWGYPERLMTAEEFDMFTGYLDRAFAENGQNRKKNVEQIFAELRQWFQTLEIR